MSLLRTEATNAFLNSSTDINRDNCKKIAALAKKTFLQKKRAFRNNFYKEINPTKNINNLWKSLSALKSHQNSPISVPHVTVDDEKINTAIQKVSEPPRINYCTADTESLTLIRSFRSKTHDFILSTFNSLYKTGIYPESWRSYNIILLPKSQGKGYRPISLAAKISLNSTEIF